ncbi:hypothetical protein [Arthrobacter sp. GMC3]|uniref:hypothetical protein n=1 Tax=Arthrobacter sp. GMC3 TaxID=2058894 RepID=UPI000CE3690B|nr:hypothetical protein [Arthrobacter sp. GMC3]
MQRESKPQPRLGLLLGAIAAVAFSTRLLPLLVSGTLGGFRGYDDGVHYASAVHLIAGSLPYRDFVFVHPPGIALLLAPFALLGHLVSDTAGISAARIVFVLVGTLNAVLVGVLLKKWGYPAVIAGSGLYALWSVATIAERSIMLSPLLNACVLAALLALRSGGRIVPRRAVTLAAVFLGLALCFKLWAVLPIGVIGVMVAVRFGPRLLLRFTVVGALVCTVIMGPFFVMAPGAMFTDVILAQLVRTDGASRGLMYRLRDFVGADAPAALIFTIAALGVLCIVTTIYAGAARRRRLRDWGDEVWWAFLAIVISVALLTSDSFFDHYPNFVAPQLALCLGVAVGSGVALCARREQERRQLSRRRVTVPVAAAVAGAVLLAPVGVRGFVLEPQPLPHVSDAAMAAAAAPYACVFTAYSYMGVVSDSLSRSMQHGCGSIVDVFGMRLVQELPADVFGAVLPSLSAADLQVSQLKIAQAAAVQEPYLYYGMSAAAITELTSNFVLSSSSGTFQIWVRK